MLVFFLVIPSQSGLTVEVDEVALAKDRSLCLQRLWAPAHTCSRVIPQSEWLRFSIPPPFAVSA